MSQPALRSYEFDIDIDGEGDRPVKFYLADEVEQCHDDLHLLAEQIQAVSKKGSQAEIIAQRLLARLTEGS